MECLRLSHPKKSGVAPNATAEVSIDSDVAKITFKGAWLLSDTRTDIAGVVKELNSDFVKKVRFDLSGVTTYDSSLISFLLRVYEASAQKNADFDFKSLPQGPRSLLRLAVAVPEGERKKLDAAFEESAKELLAAGVEVGWSKEVKTGFKVGAKEGGYYISFADADIEALLAEYLRDKVFQLLFKA